MMAEVTLTGTILSAHGTRASLATANPILKKAQLCVEIDTGRFKWGDGANHWNDLKYATNRAAVVSTADPTASDAVYDLGQVWLNTSTDRIFYLVDNAANAAVWRRMVSQTDYATTVAAGVVKSSTATDKISVGSDGVMSINTVSGSRITGSVPSANKLATARTVSISGDVTAGAVAFDGSSNVSLTAALVKVVDAGTGCKITVNDKGLVTAYQELEASDIPTIPSTKVSGLGTAATKNVGTAAGNVVVVAADGKIDGSLMPALAITEPHVVTSQAQMLALTAQTGDVAIRTDEGRNYILRQSPASTLSNWTQLALPDNVVLTVNGKNGPIVSLTTDDITEGTKNLYYTEARATANFNANFAKKSSSGLTDGATILHSTDIIIFDGGEF